MTSWPLLSNHGWKKLMFWVQFWVLFLILDHRELKRKLKKKKTCGISDFKKRNCNSGDDRCTSSHRQNDVFKRSENQKNLLKCVWIWSSQSSDSNAIISETQRAPKGFGVPLVASYCKQARVTITRRGRIVTPVNGYAVWVTRTWIHIWHLNMTDGSKGGKENNR